MLGFLPYWVRVYVFILIAQIAALILMRAIKLPFPERRDCSRAWLILTAAAFFGFHFMAYAFVALLVGIWLRRKHPNQVPAVYIAILPVIPLYGYVVPGALGINNFIALDHQRLLTLGLLLPALMATRGEDEGERPPLVRNAVDAVALLFIAWLIFLSLLHRPTVTDKLRGVFEVTFFTLVPYLTVSRFVRTSADLKNCILAIAFSGLFVAMVGVMEQRMTAYFYQEIPYRLKMDTFQLTQFARAHDIRFGLLRIKSSIDGGLGFFLVFCLAAYICLGRLKVLTGWRLWVPFLLVAMVLFFTGSRGPWIMAGIVFASTWAFGMFRSPGRFVMVSCVALLAAPSIRDHFMSTADQFGTFSYRAELLRSTLPMVFERPFAGWGTLQALFATGRLEHLRQGQGIIDMVNIYLGIAVLNGIPGLLLFGSILIASLWAVVKTHARRSLGNDPEDAPIATMLVTLLLGTTFYLSTISFVGHVETYLWTLVALCSAYTSMKDSPAEIPAVVVSLEDQPPQPALS
ncbi:MAG: hypothetical protein RL030_930 [Pseudomonadota bacterium]